MESMQSRILRLIEVTLQDADLEVAQQTSFSNRGHVYGIRGLYNVVDICFEFDSTSCQISLDGPAIALANPEDNPPAYRVVKGVVAYHNLKYTDGARLEGLLKLLRTALRRARATQEKIGA